MLNRIKSFLKDEKKYIIFIFILALLIRLLFVAFASNPDDPKLYEHGRFARNMLTGHGYSMNWHFEPHDSIRKAIFEQPPRYEGAILPPLSPYVIYYFMLVFGDNATAIIWLMIFYSIIGSIVAVLTYKFTDLIAGRKYAPLAGFIAAIYPPAAYSVVTFSGSVFYYLFAMLALYYMIKCVKEKRLIHFLLFGLFSGFQTLIRAEYLSFTIAYLAMILFFAYKNKAVKSKQPLPVYAFVAFMTFAAVVTPWIVRNTMLFGQFIPITSHPWFPAWRGNNIWSGGGMSDEHGDTLWADYKRTPALIDKLDSLPFNQHFELAADSVFKIEVIKYWKEHPVHAVTVMAKRALLLWTIDIYTAQARNIKYIPIVILSIIPFFIGLFRFFKEKKCDGEIDKFIIYISFFAIYTVFIALIFLQTRYQVYLLTMGVPLIAIGYQYLYEKLIKNNLSARVSS